MNNDKIRSVIASRGNIFGELALRIKLILRLMGDSRVSPFLKLIPVGALIYLVNPIDLPGPIDDAMVLWLGGYFFVELCPPAVVQEHMNALRMTAGNPAPVAESEVIDAEYKEVK